MTVGLIAGGPGEKQVISILAGKILQEPVVPLKTRGEGELFVATKVAALTRVLRDQHSIRKVIVCVDSHSDNQGTHDKASATRREIAKLLGVRAKDLRVDYVVIVHELEGWLLAAEGALKAVLGKNAKLNLPGNIESHCKQAELLKEIFRKNAKPDFDKVKHNPDIAERADPDEIQKRMPSFRLFVKALKDP